MFKKASEGKIWTMVKLELERRNSPLTRQCGRGIEFRRCVSGLRSQPSPSARKSHVHAYARSDYSRHTYPAVPPLTATPRAASMNTRLTPRSTAGC